MDVIVVQRAKPRRQPFRFNAARRLFLRAAPLEVRPPVPVSGHEHLKLTRHHRIFQFINQTKPWSGLGCLGQENRRARIRSRDYVVNDVAFVVEVDRLQGLARSLLVDVQDVAVLTIEGRRSFASSGVVATSHQHVMLELRLERVSTAALGASRTSLRVGVPRPFQKANCLPRIGGVRERPIDQDRIEYK